MSEFDDLLEQWQDGQLSAEQEDALIASLLADESKRLAVLQRGLLQAEVLAQRRHDRQDTARLAAQPQPRKAQRPGTRAVKRLPKRRSRARRRGGRENMPAALITAAAALIVTVVVGIVITQQAQSTAAAISITALRGEAQVDGRAAVVGMPIEHGAIITVTGNSAAQITTPDGSTLMLGAATRMQALTGQRWHISAGSVSCEVSKRAPGTEFRVRTDYCETEVIGTRFSVEIGARHRVTVREGIVRVHHPRAATKRLVAGEQVLADADGWYEEPAGVVPPPDDTRPDVDPEAQPTPPEPAPIAANPIRSFTLIDVDTGAPVAGHAPLAEGAVIDLADLGIDRFTIRIDVDPDIVIDQMQFSVNGRMVSDKPEMNPPWSVTGNRWESEDLRQEIRWKPWVRLPRGTVVIEAFPTVGGNTLPPATITVTIN